ncbi:MAG: carbohydrate ABC transporter permease, partial [Anaerolineae bacterium]|nr:carbohydrate ABC transporter permease [Anaerolineae bacterium]
MSIDKARLARSVRQVPFYLIVGLILLYLIFPIYWMLITSFRPPGRLFAVEYWPAEINLINYRFLTINQDLLYGLYNSIIISLAVLILTLSIGACAAYALGRLKFRGQRTIYFGILALTAFPTISIVGGLYLLVTNPCVIFGGTCQQFQLYNTRTALVITYLILTLPLTIWFLTNYYRQLPVDLEDAAYVDGATPFQTFTYIFLPLSAPALMTTGLLAFIISWGEFLFALTFTID